MSKFIYPLFAVAMLMAFCSTPDNKVETVTIASRRGECATTGEKKCLLVKAEGETNWTFFYEDIEGFNYEPGYEYVIEVKKHIIENTFADIASVTYVMAKEISKIEKKSKDLPEIAKME